VAEQFVSLEPRDGGVVILRLDRPKMNALSSDLLGQLADSAESLAADPPGAVVVWGGPRIFAAGADVNEFVDEAAGRPSPERARLVAARFRRALDAVAALPVPTIAAVDGYALGGGCELALACDLRVAAPNARFGQPEILLGIIPGGGGTQRLTRLVGPARSKDLILTGRQVGAEEALRIGLADRLAGDAGALEEALGLAATLAAGPPAAMALAKSAIDAGADVPLESALDEEESRFVEVFGTQDAAVGVASFLEHGPGQARFRPS
jgi:enoyl-CoA hydratase/carnithine racemase